MTCGRCFEDLRENMVKNSFVDRQTGSTSVGDQLGLSDLKYRKLNRITDLISEYFSNRYENQSV
jgi:hypothetical protein